MWLWSPIVELLVLFALTLSGVGLVALVGRGTERVVNRLERDLSRAPDRFYLAVLLAYQKGRRPDRILDLAVRFRRQADLPVDTPVPPDPVLRELTAWFRQRIPGWTRRWGARLWGAVVAFGGVLSMLGFFASCVLLASQAGGPDPAWDDGGAYLVAMVAGSCLLSGLLSLAGRMVERNWEDRLMRTCTRIVREGLGDTFNDFVLTLADQAPSTRRTPV